MSSQSLTQLTAQQYDWWSVWRQRGRAAYIWQVGILSCGLPGGLAWGIGLALLMEWNLAWSVGAGLILAPLGGYCLGEQLWNDFESRYAATDPANSPPSST
ncbi:MAG: hypothetical protein SFX18_11410 [Pirellulales bacterium]|nr:hypothetical protein [Pirellulales bacterium]